MGLWVGREVLRERVGQLAACEPAGEQVRPRPALRQALRLRCSLDDVALLGHEPLHPHEVA